MITSMTSNLMTFVQNTLQHLWCILCEIRRTEESGFHTILLQTVQNPVRAHYRDLHALFERKVYTMLTRPIKFLCIKTQ